MYSNGFVLREEPLFSSSVEIHTLKGLGHAILGNFSIDQVVI